MDERLTPPGETGARTRPPWRAVEAVPVALGALVSTLIIGGIVGVLASEGTTLVVTGLAFEVSLAGWTILWIRVRHRAIDALRLGSTHPLRALARGALAGVGLFAVTVLVVAPLLYGLLGVLLGRSVTVPEQEVLPADPAAWQVALGAVVVVGLAPVGEELFFRGLLFGGLRGRLGFAAAGAISSAVFALFHVLPLLMPLMFVVGFGLAYLYDSRGSLLVSMAAHAGFNLVGYTLIVLSLS